MKVYVYALCEPTTNAVRYVGISRDVKKRLQGHSFGNKRPVARWIKTLQRAGFAWPKVRLLEVATEKSWEETERWWIAHYRAAKANLLNISSGGTWGGSKKSRDTKLKIGVGNKAAWSKKTKTQRAAIGKRMSEGWKRLLKDNPNFTKVASVRAQGWWDKNPKAKREVSALRKAWWAKVPSAERSRLMRLRARAGAAKIGEASKKRWAKKSAAERSRLMSAMAQKGLSKIKASAKARWAKMTQAERNKRMKAVRAYKGKS